jgi:hypothetical protein
MQQRFRFSNILLNFPNFIFYKVELTIILFKTIIQERHCLTLMLSLWILYFLQVLTAMILTFRQHCLNFIFLLNYIRLLVYIDLSRRHVNTVQRLELVTAFRLSCLERISVRSRWIYDDTSCKLIRQYIGSTPFFTRTETVGAILSRVWLARI